MYVLNELWHTCSCSVYAEGRSCNERSCLSPHKEHKQASAAEINTLTHIRTGTKEFMHSACMVLVLRACRGTCLHMTNTRLHTGTYHTCIYISSAQKPSPIWMVGPPSNLARLCRRQRTTKALHPGLRTPRLLLWLRFQFWLTN
jgi:hypothetical protein